MYIDLLVDFIPKSFNELFKFNPADEPLLAFAFNNSNNRTELKEFERYKEQYAKLAFPELGCK